MLGALLSQIKCAQCCNINMKLGLCVCVRACVRECVCWWMAGCGVAWRFFALRLRRRVRGLALDAPLSQCAY